MRPSAKSEPRVNQINESPALQSSLLHKSMRGCYPPPARELAVRTALMTKIMLESILWVAETDRRKRIVAHHPPGVATLITPTLISGYPTSAPRNDW